MCVQLLRDCVCVPSLQLEKLNPSPPSKSSHAYPPPLAPPPTTSTARETHSLTSSMVNGRGTLHLPGGVERKEKREVFTGKKRGPSLTKTASERASHGVREEGRQRGREEDKKRRKEKDGSLSSSKKATSLHLSTPHSNSTAVFGPPLSFGGTPTSHSKKSPTPGSTDPRPSRVPHSSSTKINLAEGEHVDVTMTSLVFTTACRHIGHPEVKGRGAETGSRGYQHSPEVPQTAPSDL